MKSTLKRFHVWHFNLYFPLDCNSIHCHKEGAKWIYWSIYFPILAYGYEHWVMIKRTKSQIQAAEMSGMCEARLTLRDKERSTDIQERLGVELLFLHVKRSHFWWFGNLVRMPPGYLPERYFRHVHLGGDVGVDPGHAKGIISLGWPRNASGSSKLWMIIIRLFRSTAFSVNSFHHPCTFTLHLLHWITCRL